MEGWRKAVAPWGTWSCGVTEKYGVCASEILLASLWHSAVFVMYRLCVKNHLHPLKEAQSFGPLLVSIAFWTHGFHSIRRVQIEVVDCNGNWKFWVVDILMDNTLITWVLACILSFLISMCELCFWAVNSLCSTSSLSLPCLPGSAEIPWHRTFRLWYFQ